MANSLELQAVNADKNQALSSELNDDRLSVDLAENRAKRFVERDDKALTRLGKVPVLKRNFAFMSMLGFSCTVMNTWEGEVLLFLQSFNNGGSAGSIYGFIIVWVGTLCVFATMGELASMAPTSGGQYHWVYMLAPKRSRKFLSYFIGWLTVIGWQAAVASLSFLAGTLIQGLAIMGNEDYHPAPWQTTLLGWAAIAFAVFFNTVISSALPKVEGVILIIHILGFFAILIPLVYISPHVTTKEVFTVFYNGGGWPTQGLSFMLGMIASVFNFLGADSAVHMSEEIQNAAVIVPRAMVFTVILNGALGLGILIAVLYCIGDIETALASPTGYPFMTIFEQGVGSVKGAQTMAAVLTVLMLCATVSLLATASRMTWSFARDRGLPGWFYLSKIDARTSIPIIAIALTTVISYLLALISIGSSVAFNDIVSLTINGLYGAYFIGNSLLLWRRCTCRIRPYNRDPDNTELINVSYDTLYWGPTRIPEPLGTITNAFGCAYLLVILVFSFWPTAVNPSASAMNMSSLMVGVTLIWSVLYYVIWARKVYSGPVIQTQ
ncbi:amino acid transporter [Xylariomycetidae sp. FL2044]|nr:amino acid transporter [Xylariomycetidae sp. FL2044]